MHATATTSSNGANPSLPMLHTTPRITIYQPINAALLRSAGLDVVADADAPVLPIITLATEIAAPGRRSSQQRSYSLGIQQQHHGFLGLPQPPDWEQCGNTPAPPLTVEERKLEEVFWCKLRSSQHHRRGGAVVAAPPTPASRRAATTAPLPRRSAQQQQQLSPNRHLGAAARGQHPRSHSAASVASTAAEVGTVQSSQSRRRRQEDLQPSSSTTRRIAQGKMQQHARNDSAGRSSSQQQQQHSSRCAPRVHGFTRIDSVMSFETTATAGTEEMASGELSHSRTNTRNTQQQPTRTCASTPQTATSEATPARMMMIMAARPPLAPAMEPQHLNGMPTDCAGTTASSSAARAEGRSSSVHDAAAAASTHARPPSVVSVALTSESGSSSSSSHEEDAPPRKQSTYAGPSAATTTCISAADTHTAAPLSVHDTLALSSSTTAAPFAEQRPLTARVAPAEAAPIIVVERPNMRSRTSSAPPSRHATEPYPATTRRRNADLFDATTPNESHEPFHEPWPLPEEEKLVRGNKECCVVM